MIPAVFISWFAAELGWVIADDMDTRVYDTPYMAVMDPGQVITPETAAYIEVGKVHATSFRLIEKITN